MNLKPYPEYKDSGVYGIDIPINWSIYKLKSLVSKIGSGITPKGGSTIYVDEGVPLLRSQNVHFNGLRLDDVVYITEEINRSMSSSALKNHDVLLNITGASIGRCSYVENHFERGNVNQHVCILRPSNIFYPYLNYFLMSGLGQDQIFSVQMGTSREGLNFEQIGNFRIIYPPLIEQKLIVEYLDKKTSEINLTIEKDTRLIELLKEKRTALINHVVTKGLDPTVKMKDSGVEWIGEIPGEWEARKIKTFSVVRRGASPRPIDDPKYFDEKGEYSWVRIADVTASSKYLYNTTEKLSILGKSFSVPLEPDELFISIAGSVGKPIITKIKCCIHDGFVYFQDLKIDPEYLYYIFIGGQAFQGLGKLGTQLNLNTETIGNIKIPHPSKEALSKTWVLSVENVFLV